MFLPSKKKKKREKEKEKKIKKESKMFDISLMQVKTELNSLETHKIQEGTTKETDKRERAW